MSPSVFTTPRLLRFPDGVPIGGKLPPSLSRKADDTREVIERPEFGKEAKGYRLIIEPKEKFTDQDLPAIVNLIQQWAVLDQKEIDFGGSVSLDNDGRCIIQGEFAPNRFENYQDEDFLSLVHKLKAELSSTYGKVSGGLRDYADVKPNEIEAVVGTEPGYKGVGAVSFEQASQIVSGAVRTIKSLRSGIVFYSYESSGKAKLCSEPVVVLKGTSENVNASISKIALDLRQTSVHAVAGHENGRVIHHAYKVKGELTAREEAAHAMRGPTTPFISEEELLSRLGNLASSDRVKKALSLVSSVSWEPRIGGGPALEEHIYAVTNEVHENAKILGWDETLREEAVVTAILHDYIEDIDSIGGFSVIQTLFGHSDSIFGEQVANNVALLSHNDEADLSSYFERIKGNQVCSLLKVSDRNCNLLTAGSLSERSQANYIAETARFILPIARSFGSQEVARKIEQHLLPANISANSRYATGLPFVAAAVHGGVTFEISPSGFIGSWTFTSSSNETSYGTKEPVISIDRTAVYIPTIQKNGEPVAADIVEALIEEAHRAGFVDRSPAVGAWILGHDADIPVALRGTIQSESIWICGGRASEESGKLALQLAKRIVSLCNQDSVAVELDGQLVFLDETSDVTSVVQTIKTASEQQKGAVHQVKPYEGPRRLVVIPLNDGEAYVARDYLLRQPGVDVITSRQPWGASWEATNHSTGLEDYCVQQIEDWREKNPDGTIYGYELSGENAFGARTLNGNTTEEPSTFALAASVLSAEPGQDGMKLLNNYERLIAAHTAAGFGPLKDELHNQGIDPDSPYGQGVMTFIAKLNRACLGITPSEEAQALRDIYSAERIGDKVVVKYNTSSWVPQADSLFGDTAVSEHLHIPDPNGKDTCDPEQRTVYYGYQVSKFCELMQQLEIPPIRWWYREPVGNYGGYFGLADSTPEEQARIQACFLS